MVPQGSSLINTEYFDNLIESINNVQTCEELQRIANESMATLSAIKAAIAAEMAQLEPILALLTAPGANLTAIVNWISNFINGVLRPMYQPYLTYEAQLIQLTSKIAELISALNNAASRITHCSITIPTP